MDAHSVRASVLPKSTPVPNFFLDVLMPRVPPRDFAVLLFAWRKTIGWNKLEECLPLSQIQKGTGLCRSRVLRALRFWESLGLLGRAGRGGPWGATCWRVNVDYDRQAIAARLDGLGSTANRSAAATTTGSETSRPPGSGMDTQKGSIQKEKKEAFHLPGYSGPMKPEAYDRARRRMMREQFKAACRSAANARQRPDWRETSLNQLLSLASDLTTGRIR